MITDAGDPLLLSDLDFDLPEDLIALRPVKPRHAARLLVWNRGCISDRRFADLPDLLGAGDHLVFNDTRVIPAALRGWRQQRAGGEGRVSVAVNLDQARSDGLWTVLARPARRLKQGDRIEFGSGLQAAVVERDGDRFVFEFNRSGDEFRERIGELGQVPLPPYIAGRRQPDEQDRLDYQTTFASRPGAVAAPTASLHFDDWLLDSLRKGGTGSSTVTLHVGAGTFLPIRHEDISSHDMHAEWGEISSNAADEVNSARKSGKRIIAVGTTALRLLETAARDGEVLPWQGDTSLFIRPGYEFYVDGLITNFHLPKSTLIVLVAAFVGLGQTRRIYRTAVEEKYRFFSYGDGSLLLK